MSGIPIDNLEAVLASIAAAKGELLLIDPSPRAKKDLDEAFVALANAQRAILRLLGPEGPTSTKGTTDEAYGT